MTKRKKGKKGKPQRTEVTRRMQLFLDTARDRGMTGKSMALKEIAESCGLDPTRPSKWMRIPAFREAFALLIRDVHAPLVEASIAALLQLAIRGNLLAFEKVMTWLERLGRLGIRLSDPRTSATAAPGVAGVEIHIHQIPEPASRATLPPPLELPGKATTTQPANHGGKS